MRWWAWALALGMVLIGSFQIRDYERRRSDPCWYVTRGELNNRYPELRNLWEQHKAELDAQEAQHKAQNAIIDLRIKQGTISDLELVSLGERQGKELDDLIERQGRQFQNLCRRLVGH